MNIQLRHCAVHIRFEYKSKGKHMRLKHIFMEKMIVRLGKDSPTGDDKSQIRKKDLISDEGCLMNTDEVFVLKKGVPLIKRNNLPAGS